MAKRVSPSTSRWQRRRQMRRICVAALSVLYRAFDRADFDREYNAGFDEWRTVGQKHVKVYG